MAVDIGGAIHLAPLWKVTLALALGLLIGIERQRAGKEVGLRTFALTCLAGTLGALISQEIAVGALGFVAVVVIIFNVQDIRRDEAVRPTTSIALLVTALLGVLVAVDQVLVAVATAVLTTLILAWRAELVGFAVGLSEQEVRSALYLGILTFVIYPVLPEGFVDPLQLINPRAIWVTVILIAVIGFVNYILLRLYGTRGLALTGFLGGVVNSSATIVQLATVARGSNGQLRDAAIRSVLIANAAMFLRNGVILLIFAPAVALQVAVPLGAAVLASLVAAFARRLPQDAESGRIALDSPFSVGSVLRFGLLFLVITVASVAAQRSFGDSGFYLVSLLAGFVSSASASATAATLAPQGRMAVEVAAIGALAASLASAIIHPVLVWRVSADRAFTRAVALGTGLSILAGAAGMLLGPAF